MGAVFECVDCAALVSAETGWCRDMDGTVRCLDCKFGPIDPETLGRYNESLAGGFDAPAKRRTATRRAPRPEKERWGEDLG